jgi:RNA polymerase sigma-70 factor (ECF subfamily)
LEEPRLGDQVARFEEVFEAHDGTIMAYLRRRSGSDIDTEDVAATTFMAVWRRIDALPAGPDVHRWVLRIARGNLSNLERGRRRQRLLWQRLFNQLPTERASLDVLELRPDDGLAMRAFVRLRPSEREVIRLVAWDGMSHAEAAEMLGCSENALNIRLHRARRSLQRQFDALRSSPQPLPSDAGERMGSADGPADA